MNTFAKSINYLLSVICVSFLFIGCSAEDGEDGTIGPQGPQGEQGAAGPQGETGTANVIYSDWIPNNFSPGGGLLQKVFVLAGADDINALGIGLDTSTVMVFGRGDVLLAQGDEVFPLPYVTGSGDRYSYTINDGQIRAVGLTTNVANNDFDVFDAYRYIVIPGGLSVSGKTVDKDYNKMTYNEVVALFHIKD